MDVKQVKNMKKIIIDIIGYLFIVCFAAAGVYMMFCAGLK